MKLNYTGVVVEVSGLCSSCSVNPDPPTLNRRKASIESRTQPIVCSLKGNQSLFQDLALNFMAKYFSHVYNIKRKHCNIDSAFLQNF